MDKITKLAALRTFFTRDDKFSPGGGRELGVAELKVLTSVERTELARLCAVELGVELSDDAPVAKAA